MRRVREGALGVWEFVAGDDWRSAAGVVGALALTALVSERGAAWFVMPVAVGFLLVLSIRRAARNRDRG